MKKFHFAWWILASCCIIQLGIMGIGASTAGVFFTPMAESLGISVSKLSIYHTIMNITMMLLLPTAGKLLRKYDIRLTTSFPTMGIVFSFLLMSRVTAVWQVYLIGLFMGMCFSFVLFLAVPIILNNWFQEKIGVAMGLAMSFSGIGGILFCAVAGMLIQSYNWRIAYMVLAVCIAIIVLPFTVFVIRMRPADKGLLPYGADTGDRDTATEGSSVSADISGLEWAQAVETPSYRLLLLFAGVLGLLASMQSAMPTYAASLGFSAGVSSIASSAIMLGVLVSKIILGVLNDRLGVKRTLTLAYIPCFISILLIFMAGTGKVSLLFSGAALYGIICALSSLEPPLLTRALFGSRDYESVFASIQRAYTLCSAFALPIYNAIYGRLGSFSVVIIMLLIFLACSFFCFRVAFIKMGK